MSKRNSFKNSFKTPAQRPKKKQKTDDGVPPPSLEHSQVQEINLLLSANGGSISLGRSGYVPYTWNRVLEQKKGGIGEDESGAMEIPVGSNLASLPPKRKPFFLLQDIELMNLLLEKY